MTDLHHDHDHDRGLAHDLRMLERVADRRFALRLFAGVGTAALVGACGGESSGSSASATTATPTPTVTPTPTATATPTPTPTSTTTACVADASETNGPYPADGTNTSSGATSNVLIVSGVVRSDLRSSFVGSSTTVATGTLLTLTLKVVNTNASCAGLAGYAVYLWGADRNGQYSLYDLPAESYLRGVQVTNAAGEVTFTTIFPGCYAGRYPHFHIEVFSSLAAATRGSNARLIGQIAMPSAICNAVYAQSALYPNSASRFASIGIANDNVFGNNTAAQIAQQTPALTGSNSAGYTGSMVVGVAV